MSIERLQVGLDIANKKYDVGELVRNGKDVYFKYYAEYLNKGLNISPIKLSFNDKGQKGNPRLFDGLFGVFSDSLPDGWGRLLLDRMLVSKGRASTQIHPLDRLAYVGIAGPGALTYKPVLTDPDLVQQHLELDILSREIRLILDGSSSEVIDELFQLGGTSGGARPKIQVGYHKGTDHLIHGTDDLPLGYEHWIIKFASSLDRSDSGNIEFAYYLMALEAGIEMEECKLFTGKSGEYFFGTKRFDRVGKQRLHMHSASGIMHDDYRYSQMDYGHIMDCAFQLERDVRVYEKVLRSAAFNVYSNNRDDHSKNFSFLMDELGKWRFAPAYDLTFSSSSHGMHSTMVAGESRHPGQVQLLELARIFDVKTGKESIDQIKSAVSRWPEFAQIARVSKESTQLISKTIATTLKN
jgi:serine/threonine-protein kinase HipA